MLPTFFVKTSITDQIDVDTAHYSTSATYTYQIS